MFLLKLSLMKGGNNADRKKMKVCWCRPLFHCIVSIVGAALLEPPTHTHTHFHHVYSATVYSLSTYFRALQTCFVITSIPLCYWKMIPKSVSPDHCYIAPR